MPAFSTNLSVLPPGSPLHQSKVAVLLPRVGGFVHSTRAGLQQQCQETCC